MKGSPLADSTSEMIKTLSFPKNDIGRLQEVALLDADYS
jgi:hypothetical protein